MIRIGLLKDADEPFSSRDVYTLPAGVVIGIVCVLHARKCGNRFSSVGIENGQARRFMRGDKAPVIGFIQSHREIVLECHGPANDGVSLPVDHGNLFQVRQIHVGELANERTSNASLKSAFHRVGGKTKNCRLGAATIQQFP